MEVFIEVLLKMVKVIVTFYISGIIFTCIIWPCDEQDTTKFQWTLGVVVVTVLNYFIWR